MKKPVKLSNTEIDFLLDGSYYGNQAQYWKRSAKIEKILESAIQYTTGKKK